MLYMILSRCTQNEMESVRVRRESDYLFVIRDYLVEHGMKYDELQ